jgi:serine acetyltransferase
MKVIAHIIHNHNLKSTGVDINESAVIGENVFIPHPVGIVIGGQRVLEMIVP